jgi:type III secretion protein T
MPMPFNDIGNNVLGVALTLPRILAAFMALPLLSSSDMPPLVRNSFFVSLSIVVFPLAAAASPYSAMGAGVWPFVIVKELFVGLAIGFSFGVLFWAIGNAGNLIFFSASSRRISSWRAARSSCSSGFCSRVTSSGRSHRTCRC